MKFTSIKSVSAVEVENKIVYDIQLKENHYFSANNIITHRYFK